jgi:hypothetical protein
MVANLTKEEIFDFIIGDFKAAWGALEPIDRRKVHRRGNFMFARQAMNLLEAAALLCSSDSGSKTIPCTGALQDLSQALYAIDKRYFTELPGPCADNTDFRLPFHGSKPNSELIWAMFDLIRHGLAHQYQQAIVQLADPGPGKTFFGITLTGPIPKRTLERAAKRRPYKHLGYKRESCGLWLYIRTDRLFVDIERAVKESNILINTKLTFPHMERPKSGSKKHDFKTGVKGFYRFDSKALESCLALAGHRAL